MISNKSQPDDKNLLDQRTAAARSGPTQTARGGVQSVIATRIRPDQLGGRRRAGTSQARWDRSQTGCLHALPPWQPRPSRSPRGLHLALRPSNAGQLGFTGEARTSTTPDRFPAPVLGDHRAGPHQTLTATLLTRLRRPHGPPPPPPD